MRSRNCDTRFLLATYSGAIGDRGYAPLSPGLQLLELCTKNCGYPFHLQLANKDFLNELVRCFPERVPVGSRVNGCCNTACAPAWVTSHVGTPSQRQIHRWPTARSKSGFSI